MAAKLSAIYPGTFDPITNGHIDIIERALKHFDSVTILIAHSQKKVPLFTLEERRILIQKSFPKTASVKVEFYSGLLAEYCKRHTVNVVLRGLRGISDFEYEFQMATMNRKLYPELETYFLMASEKYFFVNSTLIKEVTSHGGNISELVPPHVERLLKEKLCSN